MKSTHLKTTEEIIQYKKTNKQTTFRCFSSSQNKKLITHREARIIFLFFYCRLKSRILIHVLGKCKRAPPSPLFQLLRIHFKKPCFYFCYCRFIYNFFTSSHRCSPVLYILESHHFFALNRSFFPASFTKETAGGRAILVGNHTRDSNQNHSCACAELK